MSACYLAAIRILQYRFNSEAELRRKLRAKQFDSEEIEAVLARLRREKWLDDERFAGAFVRTRAGRRVGRLRIRRELEAAGVSQAAAEQAIAENIDPAAETAALRALCERRARVVVRRHGADYLDTDEGRARLAAYLVGRGYDSALVRDVIRAFGKTK